MKVVQFGRTIEAAQGPVFTYVCGRVKREGFVVVRYVAVNGKVPKVPFSDVAGTQCLP